jgi:peptide/nickel transport system permease protein
MNATIVTTASAERPRTPFYEFWRRFRRHKLALASVVILLLIAIITLAAPLLAPYPFDEQDFNLLGMPNAPDGVHWLGTDHLGRDNFTRLLYGGRVSVQVGFAAALVATAIGTLIGAVSGFFRGWTDSVLMRATDVVLSIPPLPLILLLSGLMRPSIPALVIIIGALNWMSTARLVRGQFLSLREREYVEAARALGVSDLRLIWRHMLPNAAGPLIVAATLAIGHAILVESALSFLGFGVQPPTPTWGNLLNFARQWLDSAPWLAIPPGIMIFVTMLCVNFLGDGMRDAFDTRN